MTGDLQKPSIFKLKKQYKRLFLFNIKDYSILFRLLTWGEIKIVKALSVQSKPLMDSLFDSIWEECIIDHNIDDINETNAGLLPTVSQLIIDMSMITDLNTFVQKLTEERDRATKLEYQIEMILSRGFGYKIHEIDSMSLMDIMGELAKAEISISGVNMPELPMHFGDQPNITPVEQTESLGIKQQYTRHGQRIEVEKELVKDDSGLIAETKDSYHVNTGAMNRMFQREGMIHKE